MRYTSTVTALLAAVFLASASSTAAQSVQRRRAYETPLPAPIETPKPTANPTEKPTERPTDKPTKPPETPKPTDKPTKPPETPKPTNKPTEAPETPKPTAAPVIPAPTKAPVEPPTTAPREPLTPMPTPFPTPTPVPVETKAPADDNKNDNKNGPDDDEPDDDEPDDDEPDKKEPEEEPETPLPTPGPTESPTPSPTPKPTVAPVSTPTPTAALPATTATEVPTAGVTEGEVEVTPEVDEKAELIAAVQSIVANKEFVVEFSIWSPDGIPTETAQDRSALSPLNEAVLTSFRSLYCHNKTEEFCVVRDDQLLTTKDLVLIAPRTEDDIIVEEEKIAGPTLLLPTVSKVEQVDAGTNMPYTTYTISVMILQLGSVYVSEIIDTLNEPNMTAMEIHDMSVRLLQSKVVSDMNRIIEDGGFDGLIHTALGVDDGTNTIVTSTIGMEQDVFGALTETTTTTRPTTNAPEKLTMAPETTETSAPETSTTTSAADKTPATEDSGDNRMTLIYAGLGACVVVLLCVIVVFCYYRRNQDKKVLEGLPTRGDVQDAAPSPLVVESDVENTSTYSSPVLLPSKDSIASDSMMSEGLASWQVKPRTFKLQGDSEAEVSQSEAGDEVSAFQTGGSIVAGHAPPMGGSVMGQSMDSTLEGWSVNGEDLAIKTDGLTWA